MRLIDKLHKKIGYMKINRGSWVFRLVKAEFKKKIRMPEIKHEK